MRTTASRSSPFAEGAPATRGVRAQGPESVERRRGHLDVVDRDAALFEFSQ